MDRLTEAGMTDLMKVEQLAAEWQVSPKTLANLRSRHQGPPFVRVLGGIRYSRRAVTEWLERQQAPEGHTANA